MKGLTRCETKIAIATVGQRVNAVLVAASAVEDRHHTRDYSFWGMIEISFGALGDPVSHGSQEIVAIWEVIHRRNTQPLRMKVCKDSDITLTDMAAAMLYSNTISLSENRSQTAAVGGSAPRASTETPASCPLTSLGHFAALVGLAFRANLPSSL